MTTITRQEEIQEIHKKHRPFYELLSGTIFLVIGIAIGALWFGSQNQDYYMNLFTEGMGVIASVGITVLIIDRWYASRDRKHLKRRLIREAGSSSNDIAMNAIEQLGDEGWLTGDDGALRGMYLKGADLRRAKLHQANLQNAKLSQAILQRAILDKAELHNADLFKVDLQGACLDGANLQKTDLRMANLRESLLMAANLEGAHLYKADLQGANLFQANLFGALLQDAKLEPEQLEFVTLPDGRGYRVPSDKERFTNPRHPEFRATFEEIKRIRIKLGFDAKDTLNWGMTPRQMD